MSEIKTGDKVTITRGKDRGKAGTVAVAAANDMYAVQLDDGTAALVSGASLKAPAEQTYTKTEVETMLRAHGLDPDVVLADTWDAGSAEPAPKPLDEV